MAGTILPFPPEIDRDHFARWLSGFTDGEGHFDLSLRPKKRCRRPCPRAAFVIGLRSDDRQVLNLIRSFWGCGECYAAPGRRGWNPQVHFKVFGAHSLWRVVVPHFDRFPLLAKKRNDFLLWREGVELVYRVSARRGRPRSSAGGFHPRWTAAEHDRFVSLAAALKEQRCFRPAPGAPPLECPDPPLRELDSFRQLGLFDTEG